MSQPATARVRYMRVTSEPPQPMRPSGVVVAVDGDLVPVAGDYAVVETDDRARLVVLRGTDPAALVGVVSDVLLVR